MSRNTGSGSPPRRDRLIEESRHDPYESTRHLPEPTCCGECGASYRAGRWTWKTARFEANRITCPACRRVADDYPAGFVRLSGAFLREHRDEVLQRVRHVGDREREEHPMKRIMRIDDRAEHVLVTTTDAGLARGIGDAVHAAFSGDLDYAYTKGEKQLRVRWSREA